jgi:hypothetical protein
MKQGDVWHRASAPRADRVVRLLVVFILALVALFLPSREPLAAGDTSGNLLAGKRPYRTNESVRIGALTDGKKGREGDGWKSRMTVPLSDSRAFIDYDLGAETTITAAWLQGDNNDAYEVLISSDGEKFSRLWLAPSARQPGLRTRSTTTLSGRGRYIRLKPEAGDGFFGVTELQVFSQAPATFPPQVPELRSGSLDLELRDATTLFGLAMLAPLYLLHRRSGLGWLIAGLGLGALGVANFAWAFLNGLPVESREVCLIRGVLGAVAAFAVAREAFAPRRFPARREVVMGTLAITGVLGVLAFYNMGQPQFYSRQKSEWTFSHYLDHRQYYTTAKYFQELGYRGIYEADVAVYMEDFPERAHSIGNIPMRDLHNLQMSTPDQQRDRIKAIKSRFTPERWEALKADIRWFRESMGTNHWLDMLCDFGGNATPVWMSITHLLYSAVPPSNTGFTLLGLLDLVLLSGMFFCVFRSFGPRTALIVMTVFGANDFIMYGTNWGGATLRHDWLAYIGYGACALKTQRWALGGAFLGLAAMIRVFPGLALAGAAIPAAARVVEEFARSRKLPNLKELYAREKPTFLVIFGGIGAMLGAFLFSIVVLPPSAWPDCLKKVSQLSADPHPASIALRSLIAGADGNQGSVLRSRLPLYVAAIALYVSLIVIAARSRRIDQAAVIGMLLVPILTYPANYYIHFVFLLPLIATERRPTEEDPAPTSRLDAGIWLTLTAMCSVQYFTTLVPDLGLHFYLETAVLFAMMSVLLGVLVFEDVAAWMRREPALVPATPGVPPAAPSSPEEPTSGVGDPEPASPTAAAPPAP